MTDYEFTRLNGTSCLARKKNVGVTLRNRFCASRKEWQVPTPNKGGVTTFVVFAENNSPDPHEGDVLP